MTVGELKAALAGVPDELEVTLRASDDEVGDVCCGVRSVGVDHAHDGNDTPFLAIDGDAEVESHGYGCDYERCGGCFIDDDGARVYTRIKETT